MKLLTKRQLIKMTPDRYRQDQGKYWSHVLHETGKTREQMHSEMITLDLDNCSSEDMDSILGNSSWTRMKCDECGRKVEAFVTLGEEPDYESSTASICKECLTKALSLFPNE